MADESCVRVATADGEEPDGQHLDVRHLAAARGSSQRVAPTVGLSDLVLQDPDGAASTSRPGGGHEGESAEVGIDAAVEVAQGETEPAEAAARAVGSTAITSRADHGIASQPFGWRSLNLERERAVVDGSVRTKGVYDEVQGSTKRGSASINVRNCAIPLAEVQGYFVERRRMWVVA